VIYNISILRGSSTGFLTPSPHGTSQRNHRGAQDAFGAADIDERECCWQLRFDGNFPLNCAAGFLYEVLFSPSISAGLKVILKTILTAAICAALLAGSGPSKADQYRPDEFLSLDLSKAVLSPKPLGPTTEFAPIAIEARTDPGSEGAGEQARVEPTGNPKIAVSRNLKVTVPKATVAKAAVAAPNVTVAQIRPEKPRGAVRTKLARPHSNPLDAEARDTRIQVWPCNSGGICNWQRTKN
jgi:hypothetical protein